MRTFTTEHTVYTFNELSDDAQQAAIEAEREWVYEYGLDYLADYMQEQAERLLDKYDMKSDDIHVAYSLGYSQGDGASVYGIIEYKGVTYTVNQGHMYSHERSFTITESYLDSGRDWEEASVEQEDEFKEQLVRLNIELGKYGYDEIEHATSDETIRDLLQDGDQEYYENGKSA